VTGYGDISPLGQTVSALWENIKEGKSGITKLEAEESSGIHTQITGSITDFDATHHMVKKELSKYDLFIQYA
uniref:beta-ketoacyl synthase N-terminal-like domain-containing protein n=1 Tax=Lysinibacillus sp. D4B1_S16 TaxID=2941231 RepID=UPI0024BEBE52